MGCLLDEVEVEPDGELEIKLNGGALEGPLESVHDGDVDLWSVKSTIAGVLLPWRAKGVQTFSKLLKQTPKFLNLTSWIHPLQHFLKQSSGGCNYC